MYFLGQCLSKQHPSFDKVVSSGRPALHSCDQALCEEYTKVESTAYCQLWYVCHCPFFLWMHTNTCWLHTASLLFQRPLMLQGHERSITQIKYNREGDLLFSVGKDPTPNVWYTVNGERWVFFIALNHICTIDQAMKAIILSF